MALSNDSWNEIMQVIGYKMQESEIPTTLDPNVFLSVMRDNWELLCDHSAVTVYIAEKILAEKIALRDQAVADAEALDLEIQELQ